MSKSKSNTKYADLFERWGAPYEARKEHTPYDAPGYAENPRAAHAFLLAHLKTLDVVFSDEFWPADGHLDLKGSSNRPSIDAADCALTMDGEDGDGKPYYIRVCDFFTVLGSGSDEATGESVLVLRFLDARKTVRTIVIPRSVIAQGDKVLAAHCQARGFNVTPNKRGRVWLQHLLTNLHGPRLRLPAKAGWFEDTLQFVMPNGKVIGANSDTRVFFSPAKSGGALIGRTGSAEEWSQVVETLVPGNSRLELALAIAFTGPLLQFAPDVQPTLVNLFGETSRGKSIAGFLCGSVWGGDRTRRLKFAQSWDQTNNSLMVTAAAHTHMVLVLDEMHMCPRPGDIAYMFSQGEERGRLTSNVEARHRRQWSCLAFSTGERSLDEVIQDAARSENVSSGREARCLDIPAEHSAEPRGASREHEGARGVVEVLNGQSSSAALAEMIEGAVDQHYGHAGPEFVAKLIERVQELGEGEEYIDEVEAKGKEALQGQLATRRSKFVASLDLPEDADPLIRRVAKVFALIAVAGELAIEFDVLPLSKGSINVAVAKCFNDWLKLRGSVTKTAAKRKAIVTLRDFISTYRHAFVSIEAMARNDKDVRPPNNIVGYSKTINGALYYLLTPASMKEVTKSARRGDLIEQLREAELLFANDGRSDCLVKLPGPERKQIPVRLYAISADIAQVSDQGVRDDGTQTFDPKDRVWRDAHGQAIGQAGAKKGDGPALAEAAPSIVDKYMAVMGNLHDTDAGAVLN